MNRLNVFFALAIVFATLMLSIGCGAGAPIFTPVVNPPPDKGIVYIYRPRSPIGGAVSYTISANGTPIVKLRNGGYYPFYSPPGTIIFAAKTETMSQAAIDVVAGGTYYLKGTIGMGAFVGRPNLQVVHSAIGPSEIAECRLQDPF